MNNILVAGRSEFYGQKGARKFGIKLQSLKLAGAAELIKRLVNPFVTHGEGGMTIDGHETKGHLLKSKVHCIGGRLTIGSIVLTRRDGDVVTDFSSMRISSFPRPINVYEGPLCYIMAAFMRVDQKRFDNDFDDIEPPAQFLAVPDSLLQEFPDIISKKARYIGDSLKFADFPEAMIGIFYDDPLMASFTIHCLSLLFEVTEVDDSNGLIFVFGAPKKDRPAREDASSEMLFRHPCSVLGSSLFAYVKEVQSFKQWEDVNCIVNLLRGDSLADIPDEGSAVVLMMDHDFKEMQRDVKFNVTRSPDFRKIGGFTCVFCMVARNRDPVVDDV
jgi:hypothetical protein